jgi:ADP-ribosylglycohydrolase
MKVVPVTCLYAGELDMLERVHEAIMIHQTNKSAIDFGMAFAQLLETIILGGSLKEALEKTVTWCISQGHDEVMDACIRALSEAKMKTLDQVMEDLTSEELGGRSNQLPAAFIVPMYIFYKALGDGDVTEETYIKALRENIMAGGDTCCRAVFIGAVLAACAESVPQKWVEKTDKECIKKLEQATKSIVESVG